MIDFAGFVISESSKFQRAADATTLDKPVPTCPGWTVSDLAWHVGGVQRFWATIVEGLLEDPRTVETPTRPPEDELISWAAEQSERLGRALELREPTDVCWSWHDAGHTVGWIRRRQAHEALIHRVDMERALGELTPVDNVLAADGIDEIFRYFLDVDNLPRWATWTPDSANATVSITAGESWSMSFGQFNGTSPDSGNVYDLPALMIVEKLSAPDVAISGDPDVIDLWLWGRGSDDDVVVVGDATLADRLRAIAADSTQ